MEGKLRDSNEIAIIGAGPAGLASARWLKAQGFAPVLIDSHTGLGGQWDHSNPMSGVWPQMRTNTVHVATMFSDLDLSVGNVLFPKNQTVLDYFRSYAEQFDLAENALFSTTVTKLEASEGGGYRLTLKQGTQQRSQTFSRVVVATGRFNNPKIPDVDGLGSFTGEKGVRHAFFYKDPEEFRDIRVLVAGGSISALEIASDLSMLGAASVHLTQRRQRYVLPKMIKGVPLEYYAFSRAGALARETTTREAQLAAQQTFMLTYAGDPSRFGAPAPNPDIAKAGSTGSPHYLNLVAEGRIHVHPWMMSVEGQNVTFSDGSRIEVDAIIFGTGFDLGLDFLSADIASTLGKDARKMLLSEFSFHPDLPGLAFIGMYPLRGPYPVVLEQHARYVAYAWSGMITPPSEALLRLGLVACRTEGHYDGYRDQNEMALRFARLCGVDPSNVGNDEFQAMLGASATTAVMFRMQGPDMLKDAEDRFREQFNRYGPRVAG